MFKCKPFRSNGDADLTTVSLAIKHVYELRDGELQEFLLATFRGISRSCHPPFKTNSKSPVTGVRVSVDSRTICYKNNSSGSISPIRKMITCNPHFQLLWPPPLKHDKCATLPLPYKYALFAKNELICLSPPHEGPCHSKF